MFLIRIQLTLSAVFTSFGTGFVSVLIIRIWDRAND